MDQIFLDNNDAYVWLYDPTPWYYYLAGGAIVLGIIAVCLFPLWPMEMRQGVYYLSVAAAGFLVFIIVLAIIKYIIFALIFTTGKLNSGSSRTSQKMLGFSRASGRFTST